MAAKTNVKICPVCGKSGFLTRRWVKGSYYPMYFSAVCTVLRESEIRLSLDPNNIPTKKHITHLRRRIRGNQYRGPSRYHVIGRDRKEDKDYFDKTTAYRVNSERYYYEYVGHYSPEKYQQEMKDYKNGTRKSRPNGRIWHTVPVKNDRRKRPWYYI